LARFHLDTGLLVQPSGRQAQVVLAAWPRLEAWGLLEGRRRRASGFVTLPPKVGEAGGAGDGGAAAQAKPGDGGAAAEARQRLRAAGRLPFEPRLWDARVLEGKDAWAAWLDRIPPKVWQTVAPFPSRHWELLAFLARGGDPALDLCLANPALAFALACNWRFRRPGEARPLDLALGFLGKGCRQVEALEYLGFPATEAARRALAKVALPSLTAGLLLTLRKLLVQPDRARLLAHLPVLNHAVVTVVAHHEFCRMVRPSLLLEACQKDPSCRRFWWLYRLGDLASLTDRIGGPEALPTNLRSLAEIQRRHDRMVQDHQREKAEGSLVQFGPPPLPGNDQFQPITDSWQLFSEGQEMSHCVFTFKAKVVGGTHYFYKVMQPQRATVLIHKEAGRWVLNDLRGPHNAIPGRPTKAAVEEWLKGS
jgi:hypothetical protein